MSATEETRDPAASDDLYGAMLLAVRAWMDRHHPDLMRVTLVGEFAPNLPAIQLPITAEVFVS